MLTVLLRARGRLLQGVTLNLSYRGLMVRAGWASPERGSVVAGRLMLPGSRVASFEGEIRWTRTWEAAAMPQQPILAGIEFTSGLDESYLNFVRASLAADASDVRDDDDL